MEKRVDDERAPCVRRPNVAVIRPDEVVHHDRVPFLVVANDLRELRRDVVRAVDLVRVEDGRHGDQPPAPL